MYEDALDCGMDNTTFWGSSIVEILDYIESFKRKQRARKKEETLNLFILARLIAEFGPFTEKKEPTMPWDLYPQLFEKEAKRYAEEKELAELEEYKARKLQRIRAFNAQRREGRHEDT